ncbi:MAG: hypothetical protein A3C30_00955 [Candidatus Levybacteria bacterium RIFCSPHIGHO2_02_FULL_40_18]|nr:MAG: hypothetical protein A2869_02135 [Candidatus Levybacteria bacterium RIFCSPHIGHO2_01_FULL_40_58]OGH27266.1 MAG: hypothetical protein A3C30_00955 [Candidatus Levybacteria bacterium RIFCSPHIGHO2_02_FULL_40_18]OGH31953.1 MAG: hypothetical protein A3E43_01170 [Candidatus Levybacteria bacterium RIFCSPHIGHO2_12_FULL_40_31]OGH40707.1 MAG: hypothetical protein A2894_03075 [Candidatus Levybacteria bacterium RIFCSPLOWO2_01_FULL_40_64]OGH49346.1 MAG: hypothetical protein A3I54_01715 [Candidatus Lev
MNCLVKKLSLLLATFTVLLFGFFITAHANQAFAHTLSGNVSDSSGTDIVGAVVDVIDTTTNNNVGNDTTDGFGNYSIEVSSGTYDIEVTPPGGSGFDSAIAPSRTISGDTVVNFIFAPAGSVALSGHIYDPLGNPLQDVEVELQGTNGNVANTDSSGAYSVTVASGTYTIKISSPTYDTLSNAPLNYRFTANNYSLTENTALDITLPAKKVTVHVQDTNTNPIEQVRVETSQFEQQTYTFGGINFTGFSHYNSGPTPFTNYFRFYLFRWRQGLWRFRDSCRGASLLYFSGRSGKRPPQT